MKEKEKVTWPTLEGRLNIELTSELDALLQLSQSIQLSDAGKKRLQKLQIDFDKKNK